MISLLASQYDKLLIPVVLALSVLFVFVILLVSVLFVSVVLLVVEVLSVLTVVFRTVLIIVLHFCDHYLLFYLSVFGLIKIIRKTIGRYTGIKLGAVISQA